MRTMIRMYTQHSPETRRRAVALVRAGKRNVEVANELGVSVGTVGYWVHLDRRRCDELPFIPITQCFRCRKTAPDREQYSYLLGLYLGDGHIISKRKQHHLSVFCCDSWPGLIDAAEHAMRVILPSANTSRRQRKGCTEVKSYSYHWPCLFPQHGPGKKHNRKIELTDWQSEIVHAHPWPLIRGLIHSDGCRITNWTTRVVAGERKRYEYPRYFFSNESSDIKQLFTDTLDQVGVAWKVASHKNISVARREAVALMDLHVGPKY